MSCDLRTYDYIHADVPGSEAILPKGRSPRFKECRAAEVIVSVQRSAEALASRSSIILRGPGANVIIPFPPVLPSHQVSPESHLDRDSTLSPCPRRESLPH